MRAAIAAKNGFSSAYGAAGQLDRIIDDAKGSVMDYLLQEALPLLKPLVDDLCERHPQKRSAHLAMRLLEGCGAPPHLMSELRTWATHAGNGDGDAAAGESYSNLVPTPPTERKTSITDSPKKKALKNASSPDGKRVKSPEDNAAAPNTGEAAEDEGGSQGDEMGRKRTVIWQDSAVEEETPSDDEMEITPCIRSLTARASLTTQDCEKRASMQRRRFTVSLSKTRLDLPPLEELISLLKQVPSLETYTDPEIEQVAKIVHCQKYEEDEIIVAHGAQSDRLHIVLNGTGSVAVPHTIGRVGRGDVIGVEALLPAATRSNQQISASQGPITTISISADDFNRLGIRKINLQKTDKDKLKVARQQSAVAGDVLPDTCRDSGKPIDRGYVQTKQDRDLITKAMQCNVMVGEVMQLDMRQCEAICDKVYLVSIKAGQPLFRKGDLGTALYIVQEGLLDIELGMNLQNVQKRTGDSFGELALLYDTPRNAGVWAVKDSLLWVLPSNHFKQISKMSNADRLSSYMEIVERIPCLRELVGEHNRDVIADAFEEIVVLEGEEICVEGEDEGLLFVILEGTCEATSNDTEGTTYLGAGTWIGEDQLMHDKPATVTAIATSTTLKAVMLDSANFRTLMKALRDIGNGATDLAQTAADKASDDVKKKAVKARRKSLFKRAQTELDEQDHDVRRCESIGVLGEGSFGSVFLLKDKENASMYALKVLSKEHIQKENLQKTVQNERSVMMLLDSDWIVRCFKTYQDRDYLFLLLEPVFGGELFDIYTDNSLFGNLECVRFHIACVTLALHHMHSKRVIFRDLKLENCLLDLKGYLKLTDMGIAKLVFGKTYTVCGTADYFPPEVLRQTGHNRAADWWTAGVMLFIMATGQSPFDAPEVMGIYKNIIKGFSKVKFPASVPADLEDVIKSLCRKAPAERVPMQKGGFEVFKQMMFFSKFDWQALADRDMPAPFVPPAADFEKFKSKTLSKEIKLDFENMHYWDGSMPGGDDNQN
eukprot:TRINITY_DN28607_c0_g1_i1.p1 TRINITY_DN28607_c0_g1~~TRINITY_DN28607_c0_g1_i1.p1  ORF type:complete len:998 (-),score=272.33 TRINITY_DN28607_c0_g1_i1:156-3149(-)